jgi:hypothetical protein
MYSGTTFTNYSGAILGAHQKIDRVAYKYLSMITPSMDGFPDRKHILHFEGKNGPDGIKSKSPAKDEPWHFYDPFDEEDMQLLDTIQDHYNELVKQLKKGSSERAAFDAAWLAHAIVDGLTPAHHYPFEEKLLELKGENSLEYRDSIKNKIYIQGDTKLETFKKSWALWGTDGLISMHFLFETGVAFIIAPLSMKKARINDHDLETLIDIGYLEWFKRSAREIAILNMYDRFQSKGWTPKLVRDVRNELAPIIIKTVTLVWYSAMRDAGLLKTKK